MPVPSLPQQEPTIGSGGYAQPRAASRETLGAVARVPIAPNAPFFLMHHPEAWELSTLLEQPLYLPAIARFALVPGCNGVRTVAENESPEAAYTEAIDAFTRKKGYRFLDPYEPIPADCLPTGADAGGYLREVDAKDPRTDVAGTFHLEAWSILLPRGQTVAITWAAVEYDRWRRWLVESGLVAPMGGYLGQQIAERLDSRVERAMTLALSPDLRERRVQAATARLDAALAAQRYALPRPAGDEVDEPKPRRGRTAQ